MRMSMDECSMKHVLVLKFQVQQAFVCSFLKIFDVNTTNISRDGFRGACDLFTSL